jgi:hypothetical protein
VDYYSVLGIERTASAAEIQAAVALQRRRWHGRSSFGNSTVKQLAQDRLALITEAEHALLDPARRAPDDRAGSTSSGVAHYEDSGVTAAQLPELVVSRSASGAFPTIAAAVEAAAAQHGPCRVRIESGKYEESIELRGELALYAAEGLGSVQIHTPANSVYTIVSHGTLTLSGLELYSPHDAVLVVPAGSVRVDHCHLETRTEQGKVSAFATGAGKLILTACSITGGGLLGDRGELKITGCSITQTTQTAVCQRGSGALEISDTTIAYSAANGIYVLGSSSGVIRNCSIQHTDIASVAFGEASKGLIANSQIEYSGGPGVSITKRSSVTLEQCSISHAFGGVSVEGRSAVTIRDCTIAGCRDYSVFSADQAELTVAGGAFSGGATGVAVRNARARVTDLGISGFEQFGVGLVGAVDVSIVRSRTSDCDYALATVDDGTSGRACRRVRLPAPHLLRPGRYR